MRARLPLRFPLAFAAFAAAVAAGHPARAIVVERVVAVVGDKPILLSELRARARPFLFQVALKVPPGPERAAAETQMFKDLIEKLIDEELEAQAAEKAKLSVTADEVDNAFRNIAASQGITVAELFKEAAQRSALSEQDYRDEIRRQILEGKMLQLRVKGRIRITEEDVRAEYDRTLREERHHLLYHPSWIVLRIMPGSSPAAIEERQELAATLVERARQGASFAALAKAYSDDSATRDTGGDIGQRAPQRSRASLDHPVIAIPEVEAAALSLDPGQVSAPIRAGDMIVVLKLLGREGSHFPPYEASKNEMLQRLQAEILDKAKRKWLDELKARTHLDVRL
jgi:peptidyl-prolyl cis-trans isomerase SurA